MLAHTHARMHPRMHTHTHAHTLTFASSYTCNVELFHVWYVCIVYQFTLLCGQGSCCKLYEVIIMKLLYEAAVRRVAEPNKIVPIYNSKGAISFGSATRWPAASYVAKLRPSTPVRWRVQRQETIPLHYALKHFVLKIVTSLLWDNFQNAIICVSTSCSYPNRTKQNRPDLQQQGDDFIRFSHSATSRFVRS